MNDRNSWVKHLLDQNINSQHRWWNADVATYKHLQFMSLFSTSIKRSSIISRLSELLKDDCKQLIVRDFNLHHSHWEKWRCFTQHAMIDSLLDIITNTKLKLLLKSDTITCKTHNQFTTIDLVFNSEKIQFMTCKCKICIDLHQELNHLSIVTELCL